MEVIDIALADVIVDSKFNTRINHGDIEGLTASIKATGVQVPVGVHKTRKGEYRLVYGFRRHSAAEDAGVDTIPAVVYPTKTTNRELLLLNLKENVVRQNLNPMEEALGAKKLLDEGMDNNELSESLGWSKTLITQRLGLLDMTQVVQQAITEDKVTVQQARSISELPEDRHERFVDVASSLTVSKLKDMVEKELAKIAAAENPEPVPEPEEDESPEPEDDPTDIVALAEKISSNLADFMAWTFDEDEEKAAQSIIVVKSVDWTNLGVDDLDAFASLLVDVQEANGYAGSAESVADLSDPETTPDEEAAPF